KLRVRKTTTTTTTAYLLDGQSILEELDPSGAMQASYLTHYLAIDEMLSLSRAGRIFYPLTDALGTIYALSDSQGTLVQTSNYDVYGVRALSSTGSQTNFGYTGREHDDTGLLYSRMRYLDVGRGSWLSPDPLRLANNPNKYLYVSNRPTETVDPYGLYSAPIHH